MVKKKEIIKLASKTICTIKIFTQVAGKTEINICSTQIIIEIRQKPYCKRFLFLIYAMWV
jgi:hypothetical protein